VQGEDHSREVVSPPPVLVDRAGEAWFEVEHIVRHYPRKATQHSETTHYLVKWLGYPSYENTKEPAKRIAEDCQQVVTEYWQKQGAQG
jgi:hypothetical protein